MGCTLAVVNAVTSTQKLGEPIGQGRIVFDNQEAH